jgi:hypothetical protein
MRLSTFLARFSYVWATQGLLVQSVQGHHQDARPVSESSTDDGSGASQIPARSGLLHPRQGFDARAAAKAAIDALNTKFYSSTEAIWSPGAPWWLSGVALTSVIDYMRKTGSRDYLAQVEHMIHVQRTQWSNTGGDFRGPSTDDTGWWALAMIRMYDLTGNDSYLDISVEDEAYMYDCWTLSPCGGGMFVDIATKTYKNAIANELYIKLAASLHNRIANGIDYLARAETAWTWFQASGMIKNDSLINDGLTASSDGVCYNNNLPVWTYNQGVIIGALVGPFSPSSLSPTNPHNKPTDPIPPNFATHRTLPSHRLGGLPDQRLHNSRRSPLVPDHPAAYPGRYPDRRGLRARRGERLQPRPAGLQGRVRLQPGRAEQRDPRRQWYVPFFWHSTQANLLYIPQFRFSHLPQ